MTSHESYKIISFFVVSKREFDFFFLTNKNMKMLRRKKLYSLNHFLCIAKMLPKQRINLILPSFPPPPPSPFSPLEDRY